MAPVTSFFKPKRFLWLRWLLVAFVVFLALIFTTSWPSDLLALPLTVNDPAVSADAVIILGGGTKKGSSALPLQPALRVEKGVSISKMLDVPIIVSGGFNKKTNTYEAPLLADEAIRLGADPEKIFLESRSRDTYENARLSLDIVREKEWEFIVIVTSEYHTWRACRVFRKQFSGEVRCVPASSRDATSDSLMERIGRFRGIVREYGAIVYYWAKGYL